MITLVGENIFQKPPLPSDTFIISLPTLTTPEFVLFRQTRLNEMFWDMFRNPRAIAPSITGMVGDSFPEFVDNRSKGDSVLFENWLEDVFCCFQGSRQRTGVDSS